MGVNEDPIIAMLTEAFSQTPTKSQRLALARALAAEIDKSNRGRETPWAGVAGPLTTALLDALDREIAEDESRGISSQLRTSVNSLRAEVGEGEGDTAVMTGLLVPLSSEAVAACSVRRPAASARSEGGHNRDTLIANARRGFAEAHGTRAAICSDRAWVSQALADAGQPRLSEDEAAELGMLDANGFPAKRSGGPGSGTMTAIGKARSELVANARREFARAKETQAVYCSERAWASQALADAGQARLSDDEAKAVGIAL